MRIEILPAALLAGAFLASPAPAQDEPQVPMVSLLLAQVVARDDRMVPSSEFDPMPRRQR